MTRPPGDGQRRDAAASRVAEVLRRWDPVGVQPGVDGPIDEYDGYAPMLAQLAASGVRPEELARRLGELRAAMMGMHGDPSLDHAIAVAIVEAVRLPESDVRNERRPTPPRAGDLHEGCYSCPSCGEEIVVPLDRTEGERQRYVEDCPVCCSPVVIEVEFPGGDEPPRVNAEAE